MFSTAINYHCGCMGTSACNLEEAHVKGKSTKRQTLRPQKISAISMQMSMNGIEVPSNYHLCCGILALGKKPKDKARLGENEQQEVQGGMLEGQTTLANQLYHIIGDCDMFKGLITLMPHLMI